MTLFRSPQQNTLDEYASRALYILVTALFAAASFAMVLRSLNIV